MGWGLRKDARRPPQGTPHDNKLQHAVIVILPIIMLRTCHNHSRRSTSSHIGSNEYSWPSTSAAHIIHRSRLESIRFTYLSKALPKTNVQPSNFIQAVTEVSNLPPDLVQETKRNLPGPAQNHQVHKQAANPQIRPKPCTKGAGAAAQSSPPGPKGLQPPNPAVLPTPPLHPARPCRRHWDGNVQDSRALEYFSTPCATRNASTC